MPHWINPPWQRNLSKIAYGKTGAVQTVSLKQDVKHRLIKVLMMRGAFAPLT
jgi:hypothetical protein